MVFRLSLMAFEVRAGSMAKMKSTVSNDVNNTLSYVGAAVQAQASKEHIGKIVDDDVGAHCPSDRSLTYHPKNLALFRCQVIDVY